jgi:hypothetical protein
MLNLLRIKILVWLSLISLFTWWGSKAVMRYSEQLLSTDITYNFGDNKNGGIQFPLITFCQPDFAIQNKVMKDCNSESLDFIGIVTDCLERDKNFEITSLFESHQYHPGYIFNAIEIWTGTKLINLKHWENQIWSRNFNYIFGPCYTLDLSKVDEFKFLQYQGGTRPQVEFTFAEDIPWNDVIIILHSKYDFPDANQLNGWTDMSALRETKKLHKLEIRKIVSKRVSTQNTPCTQYDHQTCLNVEDNYLVLEKFNCQIPILYHGQHLDSLIPKETLACSSEVTRKAFEIIQAVKCKNIISHFYFMFQYFKGL